MNNKIIKSLVFGIFLFLFLFNLTSRIKALYAAEKKSDKDNAKSDDKKILKEAMFYQKLDNKKVRCNLCPRGCVISDGGTGFCRARQNINGTLYSINYGKIVSMNIDPIEKKPFFHVLPGSKSFSIASAGCNLRCEYCQNWQISQRSPNDVEYEYFKPEQIVDMALKSGSKSIAYTYSEPISFYEYVVDTSKLAKKKGLKNIVVTNGFINKEPLEYMLKYVDGVRVDLKGFNEDFYVKYTSGKLGPVLETLKTIKKSGRWLEIINLIVPGANDNDEDVQKLCKWVKENLGDDVPVHFTRFYPNYKMSDTPPTPESTVIRAREIALKSGLKYAYTGNIYYPDGETTYCPDGTAAIRRKGYFIEKNILKNGKCPDGYKIPGLWK
jgi:pyruvate formate lyase activating enzyme